MQATVLSIAGSDPTGGAGIQADIKTMTAVGVYAAAAITCITVQNSYGVRKVEPLTPALVAGQISAVLTDHHVTHIKIGMTGTAAIAEAVSKAIAPFTGEVIFDPVLSSSTGHNLYEPAPLKDVYSSLLSRASVLTPNIPELEILADQSCDSPRDSVVAAKKILMSHENLRVIIIKGGHSHGTDSITDTMVYRDGIRMLETSTSHLKSASTNTHGTGCTLASAFAAYHCLTDDYKQSFLAAVEFVQKIIALSEPARTVKNLDGQGCMLHYMALHREFD